LIEKENLVFIGKILKTTGLNGSLKIKILSDFPDRFDNLEHVYLFDENKDELVKNKITDEFNFFIENHTFLNKDLKLKFNGFNSIEDANELKGYFLCINDTDRVKIKDGNYYYYELVDCYVYSEQVRVGRVLQIDNYGGDDLLVIDRDDKENIYLPFRKEFISSIDISEKRIDVKLIEGLI
jgi:16S rRNA processing protein RimM